jgi:hypothetical protein
VRDITVDVEKALISIGEALKNLLLSKNYATHLLNTLNFESFFLFKHNIVTYVSMSVSVYKVTSHHYNSPVSAV